MVQGTLYLIRHAQSENNAKPEHQRIPDPGITDIGIEQSKLLARAVRELAPKHLYCSPFLRSLQTTCPVAQSLQFSPIVRQDLYEQGGCYQGHIPRDLRPVPGKSRSEIASLYPGWELDERILESGWNDNPSYESREMALARAKLARKWYESQADRHGAESVAMVIHANFILRMLEAFLDIDDIEDIEHYVHDPANTSINCLTLSNGRWKLRYYNSIQHLPAQLVTY